MMNEILGQLKFVAIYLDDIIVIFMTEEEHIWHLKLLFERIQSAGLQINPKKFIFGQGTVLTLGHIISHRSIEPAHDKKEEIKQMPTPKSRKQVQQF